MYQLTLLATLFQLLRSTLQPRTNTKKYRAIERSDGVITEHPRYRPMGSSCTLGSEFGKKVVCSEEVLGARQQLQLSKLAVSGDVSIGVGAFLKDGGGDGYNDLRTAEEKGIKGPPPGTRWMN
jgi:hypothetical protein